MSEGVFKANPRAAAVDDEPQGAFDEPSPAGGGLVRGGARVLLERPFTWVDLDDPAAPALDDLAQRFGWHELAVEDCRNHPQLAKVDPFGDHLFLIANSIRFDAAAGELQLRELDFFMGETYLVTVHDGPSTIVDAVAALLAQGRITSPALALHALLDAILDRFMPTLDAIGDTIEEIESEILKNLDPACLRKIFQLRRNLVAFRRAASAQRELLNTLSRRDTRFVPADLVIYFRDVYDHVVASMELIESYRDLLTGALDIYLTRAANRTNDTVKALTLIATIILPLTLITGWYGMNMASLPFADDPMGIWYVTAGMVVFTLTLLVYFRRKEWL